MLEKKYDHLKVEETKNQKWIDNKIFEGGEMDKKPYAIVIPPPNVTGKLHIGHAWDTTIQDLLIRYKKLNGFDTVWFPGMDHAGIATQAKVEQRLREKENVLRHDLGREKFIKKAWEWKEEYASTIREQWGKLGLALDYSKEKFTLDPELNKLVNMTFTEMYEKGLIYRGKRVINWDPVQKTALSNIEVNHEETKGFMYHFNYKVVGSDINLEVATTRPETMFGDTCLVVNPKDERYIKFIGKKAINPANDQELIIIADDYVDVEFGTGVMKCTPAHDFNDYEIGKRHKLEMPIVMNEDGTMNELCNEFANLDRFECRKQLIEKCKKDGTFVDAKDHILQAAISERSGAIVEPYLSDQWFVSMKKLANKVLEIQKTESKTNFFPNRFNDTLNRWMENIEDWCISRQLWWGHRIPAWYKDGETKVQVESPGDGWKQDEDVLDTWFSSQLWPYACTGYGYNNEMFERYFPTSTLVTGYDIIFFWVSRMMTASINQFDKMPFNDVLIHGLVRAEDGRKMSKSLGNGIDPMDVIKKHGADALRHFLLTNSSPGQDLRYSNEKIIASKNFINKVWNAAKYIELKCSEVEVGDINSYDFVDLEKWIITKFNNTIERVTANLEKYEFVVAAKYIYDFVWDDYCSWFLEMSKASDRKETLILLKYIFKQILIIMNPFTPFVTDELFDGLEMDSKSISNQQWPSEIKVNIKNNFTNSIAIISKIREIRANLNVGRKFPIEIEIANNDGISVNIIEKLERVKIKIVKDIKDHNYIYESDSNIDNELKEKEIKKAKNEIMRAEKMLANKGFVSKAPASKIEIEKKKLDDWKAKLEKLLK